MKFLPDSVTQKFSIGLLQAKNVSPKVLFVGGVVGVGATVFLACRATLRLEDALEERDELLRAIDDAAPNLSPEEVRRHKITTHTVAVVRIGKLYAPSLAVGAISIGMLCGAHNILTKRNAALTAAYATLDKGFREYRDRVKQEFGEDKDREFLHGATTEKTVEIVDGKKKVVDKKNITGISAYGRIFHEGNKHYTDRPEQNFFFIRMVQREMNDKLYARGYVFLNEVYEKLGFEPTEAGQVVGWVREGEGDGKIDFGIWEKEDALRVHDFVSGREGQLALDFNVDGVVADKFSRKI